MLRLRPYKLSDASKMIEWFTEEEAFMKWSAGKFSYPLTKEQLSEYYHKFAEDDFAFIMAALNEEGVPVGHFSMRMADYQKESIHMGFIVVDPSFRGKGYGKEMVALAVKYAFTILKMKRVTLGVYDSNEAAHACYKGVGFVDEAYKEDALTYMTDTWGMYDMVITDSSNT